MEKIAQRMSPPNTGQVHIWLTDLSQIPPDLILYYQQILSPEEQQRSERFRVDHARKQFIVGRALLRTSLERYKGEPAHLWRFAYNDYGKPHLIGSSLPSIHFNLSHTDGLVACAFSETFPVGLDVERVRHEIDPMALARTVFSQHELADLLGLKPAERIERFFSYWTLKEAYIKARGVGLSISLTDFGFSLNTQHPRIAFVSGYSDDAEAWDFRQFRPTSGHRMALAARSGPAELDVLCRWRVPLRDE